MKFTLQIDPKQLKGQMLQLGEKSKFKVGEDRYCAINRDSKSSLTCVFNTGDVSSTYKAGIIKLTKLSIFFLFNTNICQMVFEYYFTNTINKIHLYKITVVKS